MPRLRLRHTGETGSIVEKKEMQRVIDGVARKPRSKQRQHTTSTSKEKEYECNGLGESWSANNGG
jgi:hypothetical protein